MTPRQRLMRGKRRQVVDLFDVDPFVEVLDELYGVGDGGDGGRFDESESEDGDVDGRADGQYGRRTGGRFADEEESSGERYGRRR